MSEYQPPADTHTGEGAPQGDDFGTTRPQGDTAAPSAPGAPGRDASRPTPGPRMDLPPNTVRPDAAEGWDQAADLTKDPAVVPDRAEVDIPPELEAEIEGLMARYPDRRS